MGHENEQKTEMKSNFSVYILAFFEKLWDRRMALIL